MFHKPPVIYVKGYFVIPLRIILIIVGGYFLYDLYNFYTNDLPHIRRGVAHTRNESPSIYYLYIFQQLAIVTVSFIFAYNIRSVEGNFKIGKSDKVDE